MLCNVCDESTQVCGGDSRSLRLMLGLVILLLKKVLVFNNFEKHMSDKQSKELIQHLGIYITIG